MKALLSNPVLILLCAAVLVLVVACGGSTAPTAATRPANLPTTAAATAVSPAASPVPATGAPANTAAAANSPAADRSGVQAITALSKFQVAQSFRLDGEAYASRIFFGGRDYVGNGTDPDRVTIFTIKGEEQLANRHYTVGGFLGSLMAYLSDFDQASPDLELVRLAGKSYLRGMFKGAATPAWFLLSDGQAISMDAVRFDPRVELYQPILTGSGGPITDFVKSGTETLDGQSCNIFNVNRHEFDGVFPEMSESMVLNPDALDLGVIDSYEYRLWVCADGNLHQVQYNFAAHSKTKPDQKGTFAFRMHMYDYDAPITIQAPADAVPFGSGNAVVQKEPTRRAPPTVTPRAAALAGGTYDGKWQGFNSKGDPVSFTVQNNQITYTLINYSYRAGDCSGGAGSGHTVENAPIKDDGFTATYTNTDGERFTLAGKFTSPTQAGGSQAVQGKAHGCNGAAFDAGDTWTAVNTSLVGTPTPPPPAATETPDPQVLNDPRVLATGLFMSAAVKQLDAFAAYIDDNVAFAFGSTRGKGKTVLQAYLQGQIDGGAQFKFPNGQPTAAGSVAKFALEVAGGARPATYPNCTVTVANQKITDVTCK